MKLRTKILVYTLPLILIPFLLMALAVYYFVIRANQIQVLEQQNQSLHEAVVSFGQEIDSARRDVKLISNVPIVSEFLQSEAKNEGVGNQVKTVLELFFQQNPYYLQLSLVDEKGYEQIKLSKLPKDQELKRLNKMEYFRRTLILGTVQTPATEIQPNKFATIFTQSVGTDKFLGMIVLILNTEVFERGMRPLLKRDLETFLFDDRGIVLASAFGSNDDKDLLKEIDLAAEASELMANFSVETNRKTISNEKGKYLLTLLPSESFLMVGTFQKQAGENWFLGAFHPQETIVISKGFQAIFFTILFLAIGAVLWITAKASRYITIPLEKVTRATGKIARGETDLNLDIKTGDEVEDLAVSVSRMNHELQNYQKQLVQTAKLASMGEMTSEISHEIQNRISGISLWLQHLDSEMEADDPRQEYLDEMKKGLKGFMEMLAELKQHYKTPELDLTEIDLNLLIRNTLPFVREKLDEKRVEFKTEFKSNLPIVKGDEEKIKSVILNLLLNSVEAVGRKGMVRIKTDFDEKDVFWEVIDNGNGIAENDLSRVFYPFYSTKSGGSGLGLAISSNIISAHQGRIEIESEVGKGTTFRVLLAQS